MNIAIIEVNENNLNEIINLKVSDEQLDFIETPKQCLKEASECEYYRPAGLYINKTLVGFTMYGLFPKKGTKGRVWLDRYLIDYHYQGRGYGKLFLKNIIIYLENKYKCDEIYLSVFDNNKQAIKMYLDFGFEFNGEKDFNGEDVMVLNLR